MTFGNVTTKLKRPKSILANDHCIVFEKTLGYVKRKIVIQFDDLIFPLCRDILIHSTFDHFDLGGSNFLILILRAWSANSPKDLKLQQLLDRLLFIHRSHSLRCLTVTTTQVDSIRIPTHCNSAIVLVLYHLNHHHPR